MCAENLTHGEGGKKKVETSLIIHEESVKMVDSLIDMMERI